MCGWMRTGVESIWTGVQWMDENIPYVVGMDDEDAHG